MQVPKWVSRLFTNEKSFGFELPRLAPNRVKIAFRKPTPTEATLQNLLAQKKFKLWLFQRVQVKRLPY